MQPPLPTRPALLLTLSALLTPAAEIHAQPAPPPEQITVIGTSPLLGTGADRDSLPWPTSVLTSADLARDGPPDPLRALDEQVGGVNLSAASGNPDQPTLLFHGFAASPLLGTAQGLAVYVNGVRFNQPFGDTVNWDVLPNLAIDRLDVQQANPVFGLNALGGALALKLKTGFSYQGAQADISGGAFGQVHAEAQYGRQTGDVAVYAAASERHQNGWRDLQSSDVQNAFGDAGWRRDRLDLHINLTLAQSTLNGPGASPVELLAVDPAAQFTAPNLIANTYAAIAASGTVALSDTLSIQVTAYGTHLDQRIANGNAPSDTPCEDGTGLLCSSPGVPSTTIGGSPIPDFLPGHAYGELDRQTVSTTSTGAAGQLTDDAPLWGRPNQITAGLTFDGAHTGFAATGLIGDLSSLTRIVSGPGVTIDEPGIDVPTRVAVTDAYGAVYLTDTLHPTAALAVTLAARFNNAEIDLVDRNGTALTGQHGFNRLDPSAGVAAQLRPWLTAYAGYAEANRAPTPAELSCASPAAACSLANFFTGDPDLRQVVAHTVTAGLRGSFALKTQITATYDIGLFHTNLDHDIAFINVPAIGRAYFHTIGQTRRQGVDADLAMHTDRWRVYLDASLTDATYRTTFVESAGDNPAAAANGTITIRPGDHLPGVPAQQLKLGASTRLGATWTIGAEALRQSGQYLYGDDANVTPRLPGFTTLDLYASDQLTRRLQLFVSVQNATNAHYATYATFSPTRSVFLAPASTATNPRSESPAAPIGAFGGLRLIF